MKGLNNLRVFIRVAETRSFSKTAKELNIGQPAVSKQITAFENEVGLKLFNRSTRGLSLTEEGEAIYRKGQDVVDTYNEMMAVAQLSQQSPSGVIHVSCPTALGSLHIVPLLKQFMVDYPYLKVDLRLTDNFVDLVSEGLDIAIRIGDVKDSRIVVKKLCQLRRITVATKQYFANNHVPKVPEDLSKLNCIVNKSLKEQNTWPYSKGNKEFKVQCEGNLSVDNFSAVSSAVLSGMGVGQLAGAVFSKEQYSQELQIVLTEFEPSPLPLNIVYYQGKKLSNRVNIFIDYIQTHVIPKLEYVEG